MENIFGKLYQNVKQNVIKKMLQEINSVPFSFNKYYGYTLYYDVLFACPLTRL